MPSLTCWRVCMVSFLLTSSGCSGLKFADQTVDAALPLDFSNRTRIANSADYRFNMADNIGAVIEEDPSKPGQYRLASVSVILPPNFMPKESLLIKDDNQVYTGKITEGGAVSGNYATIGVSLSVDQAAEISIVDVSRADVPTPMVPTVLLTNYAKTKTNRKQYWIKSLLLSRVLKQFYSKIDANASGSGPAFGARGSVYATTSVQQGDFNLAVVLLDIDSYKPNASPSPPAAVGPISETEEPIGLTRLAPICAESRHRGGLPVPITDLTCGSIGPR